MGSGSSDMNERHDDPTIRPARPDEAGELTGIAMRSKAWWGYDDHFMETVRPELTVTPEQIARDHVVVIERGARLAGFAHLRRESDTTLELVSLFIDAWAIRQGLGQRLWNEAIAYARGEGYRAVTLEADPNAEPFYALQGAVVTGSRESTLMAGRVLNLMTLTLDGDNP
ncbi:MAG TPA: GNAT family N-acetyltransferase [Thermomicrobiales bacterium]|nr:GNAT family N-acetyltransferase [Thermomicrobiales bacterium]